MNNPSGIAVFPSTYIASSGYIMSPDYFREIKQENQDKHVKCCYCGTYKNQYKKCENCGAQ